MMVDQAAFLALWASRIPLLNGLGSTILAAAVSLLLGVVIGGIAAIGSAFGHRLLRLAIGVYVYLLRGLPLLVTILFAYFGVGTLWPALPAFWLTILVMALFAGAQMTEVFRGGIQAIPPAQLEAAKAIGLPFSSRMLTIVVPLTLRRAIPSITNIAIEIVKSSTLISVLGASDLFLAGQQVAARTLFIPETYLFLWGAYLLVCLVVALLGRWLEYRFAYIVF
ncbi:MAG TPA: amino acid ABC transporter permease [Devosiaceae bacterium]|jgi:polar amino acid transport system permease protein